MCAGPLCVDTGFPGLIILRKEVLTVINCVGTIALGGRRKKKQDLFLTCVVKVKRSKVILFYLLQVNSVSVEGKTHSEVVAAIKAGGDVTRLLVVDPDTDAFFKRCRVTPTSAHLNGEKAAHHPLQQWLIE